MGKYSSISVEELARRCCASGEVEAWEEFVRRFHRLIAKVVLRVAARYGDSSVSTVEDLIQETYLKLCADNYRILRDFEHRHCNAFVGFVQVMAANVVHDHFKSSFAKRRGANRVEVMSEDLVLIAGVESSGSPRAIERIVLIQQVQRYLNDCVAGVDQDRNIRVFWLYYRVGLSASAIAALPGIGLTTKGVESLLLRITRELRERMASSRPLSQGVVQEVAEGILPAESF